VRILFISRATLFTDRGGDTIQILNTARYLEELGVKVTIRLCNEKIDYSSADLIHFFNIIRPADILKHISKSGKPYVVSTVYVDYSEYERKVRKGVAGVLFKILPSDLIEYLKVIARVFTSREKIISPSYLFIGQKNAIKKIIHGASMLLPNSNSEYSRIKEKYRIEKEYRVIPNAIDAALFARDTEPTSRNNNLVICVGRIEGRKNQLNLVKALNGSRFQLLIIGSASPNQKKYSQECKKIAGSNVSFIDAIAQEKLIGYYKIAKVHVLPSWFETTGLSTLEAAAMGCNVVITEKGDTREYFENLAYYCDPDSTVSIFNAVKRAAENDVDKRLQQKIFSAYTWRTTAKLTLRAYNDILGKQNE
jgi:glycosyltransferase involved in cell wall biosynthesis